MGRRAELPRTGASHRTGAIPRSGPFLLTDTILPAGALLLAGALLVGCDGPGGEAGEWDVDPREAVAGTPVEVDPQPLAVVGESPGDPTQELDRVVSPFLLPDGRIGVPVRGIPAIRIYAADGTFLEELGRPGEGPGEFRYLSSGWSQGDTVVAFDMDTRRVTRFPPGEGPETVTLEPGPPADLVVPGSGQEEAGEWITVGVAFVGEDGRDRTVFHRFGPDGRHLGMVAEIGGFIRGPTPSGGGGPIALSPRAVFAGHGGALFLGETLTPRIQVRDGDGELLREVRWAVEGAPTREEARDRVADSAARLRGEGDPAAEAALRDGVLGSPLPPSLPAWGGLLVDPLGFLWVRPYDPLLHATPLGGLTSPGPGGEWLVFTPDGDPAGRVAVPDELTPAWIGEDRVVGIRRDALGVESVRVHALRRR